MDDRGGSSTPGAARLLDALPAHVFVLDALGTIRFASASAAALVGGTPDDLVGESVLRFVTEDTAWAYAAAVAMATDYPAMVTGPMRITFLDGDGSVQQADLWAANHLDDPDVAGIVCMITPETAAVWLGDAIDAFASGEHLPAIAAKVVTAMRGNPVMADAALVAVERAKCTTIGRSHVPTELVTEDGPWRTAVDTGIRQLHADLDSLEPGLAAAARAEGYAAVWSEPITLGEAQAPASLVMWRRREGNPSPNQLSSVHQAASILAVAWARQDQS